MLKIYTFGRCQLDLDDQTDVQFGSRKATALLVYLACTGTSQSREQLAELLWEERWPAQAQSNLRTVLARLSKRVEAYLDVTRYSVGLQVDAPLWVDAQAVGRLAFPTGRNPEVVTILASAEQIRSSIEYYLEPPVENACQTALDTTRQSLSRAEFEEAWASGQSLSLDNTFNLAYHLLKQAFDGN